MGSSSKSPSSSGDEDAHELRRGPWTLEEDTLLTHYISCHAEGHWNLLAKRSGLRRSGKSCRLRWLNYLKPDVKRGNLTPQEQLLILQLHAKWGNRWSKIALHLPGRTDNEIKNYWRTRVQKQARHLNIDSNSSAFQDMIRCSWMPRLLQKIQLPSSSPNISSHNLAASHAPIINDSSPSLPNVFPEGQFPMTENSISDSPSISSSGSMNFSHTSGMFSEYPSSPFSGMEVNTFLKGCNNVEDRGFYNDLKSSFDGMENYSLVSSMVPPEDFEESIRYCHADENKWMNGKNLADSLWNMDESWELRQLQARGT